MPSFIPLMVNMSTFTVEKDSKWVLTGRYFRTKAQWVKKKKKKVWEIKQICHWVLRPNSAKQSNFPICCCLGAGSLIKANSLEHRPENRIRMDSLRLQEKTWPYLHLVKVTMRKGQLPAPFLSNIWKLSSWNILKWLTENQHQARLIVEAQKGTMVRGLEINERIHSFLGSFTLVTQFKFYLKCSLCWALRGMIESAKFEIPALLKHTSRNALVEDSFMSV